MTGVCQRLAALSATLERTLQFVLEGQCLGYIVGCFGIGDVGLNQVLVFGAQIDTLAKNLNGCIKNSFYRHTVPPYACDVVQHVFHFCIAADIS